VTPPGKNPLVFIRESEEVARYFHANFDGSKIVALYDRPAPEGQAVQPLPAIDAHHFGALIDEGTKSEPARRVLEAFQVCPACNRQWKELPENSPLVKAHRALVAEEAAQQAQHQPVKDQSQPAEAPCPACWPNMGIEHTCQATVLEPAAQSADKDYADLYRFVRGQGCNVAWAAIGAGECLGEFDKTIRAALAQHTDKEQS
jgi:hypothetical protein